MAMLGYEARMMRVLDHIHDNPASDLRLDTLADIAAMSRFHWHRVYAAMMGETCAETVRRIRLHRASVWLVQNDWPLAQVAAACGYPNPRSFSRAFADHYGLPPATFRRRGALAAPFPHTPKGVATMFPVEIETHPERRIVALPHNGAYHEIAKAFEKLSATISARGLWPQVRGMVAVFHDDITAVPEADLRSHAGFFVGDDVALPGGLEELRIAAGRFAMLRYRGPYSGLMAGYTQLYGTWLPDSGEEARDAPPFEIYRNSPMDTAPDDLLTDICVPLV